MATSSLSQSPNLRIATFALSALAASSGMIGIWKPRMGLRNLQFDAPAANEERKLAYSLMRMSGVRGLAIGISQAIATYFGDRRTVAWILITNSIIAIVDGFISKAQIGRREWLHWGFVPVSIGFGATLLGVFDRF